MAGSDDEIRISVRLSPQAKAAVDRIMELGSYKTVQEALRRAIADELFFQEQQRDGWTVLLRKDGEFRELVWPG